MDKWKKEDFAPGDRVTYQYPGAPDPDYGTVTHIDEDEWGNFRVWAIWDDGSKQFCSKGEHITQIIKGDVKIQGSDDNFEKALRTFIAEVEPDFTIHSRCLDTQIKRVKDYYNNRDEIQKAKETLARYGIKVQ